MKFAKSTLVAAVSAWAICGVALGQGPAVDWQTYGQPSDNYGYGCPPAQGQILSDSTDCWQQSPACPTPQVIPTATCPSPVFWNASTGLLYLTRVGQDPYRFSYNSASEEIQLVNAADAELDFSPGTITTIGRYNSCTLTGWELTFWQLFTDAESTSVFGSSVAPGFLDGIRNYDQLDYSGGGVGDGVSAADNVNAAVVHRATRDWRIMNIEANRVMAFAQGCDSPWQVYTLAGFRFFRFDESLLFQSDPSEIFIDNDPDEYRIDVQTENRLYGLQLGGTAERCLSNSFTLTLGAKAGVFGNSHSIDYFEGGTAGAAVINNGPNLGRMLRAHENDNTLAVLAELNAGIAYRMGCNWRLAADYRVLGVSGIALPTDQLYHDTRGIQDIQEIDNQGTVILHGVSMRAERCF